MLVFNLGSFKSQSLSVQTSSIIQHQANVLRADVLQIVPALLVDGRRAKNVHTDQMNYMAAQTGNWKKDVAG